MTNVAAERDAFEAWYAKRHPKPTHENSTWAHCAKMDDWEVWQARAGAAPAARKVFLVATGETSDGAETYTRHDDAPPPLCDAECLYTAPAVPALEAPAAPAAPLTPDEARHAARSAELWNGPSDATSGSQYAMAGALAFAAKLAAAPQAPRLGEDALHLLHRLLSNQHTLTGPEFRAELEKIVAEESARHAAAPQAPAAPAVDALAPVLALLDVHAALLDANPYAYFELAYTRQTGWMAWITDKPFHGPVINPDRKVLARGQGDTAAEACAAAAQAKEGGAA